MPKKLKGKLRPTQRPHFRLSMTIAKRLVKAGLLKHDGWFGCAREVIQDGLKHQTFGITARTERDALAAALTSLYQMVLADDYSPEAREKAIAQAETALNKKGGA